MGIFGERCERCHRARTRQEYEGLPTCDACRERMELDVRATSEEKRSCPIDGSTMQKEIVSNIIVDRCQACGGVWLDGGELDLLKRTVEQGVASDLIRGLGSPLGM